MELKDNIGATHSVSGLSLAQFNFMLDACTILANSYKVQFTVLTYIFTETSNNNDPVNVHTQILYTCLRYVLQCPHL